MKGFLHHVHKITKRNWGSKLNQTKHTNCTNWAESQDNPSDASVTGEGTAWSF